MKTRLFYKYIAVTAAIVLGLFVLKLHVDAATYTFEQSDWTGGLDGGSTAAHPANESGWNQYSSKDALTTVSALGVSAKRRRRVRRRRRPIRILPPEPPRQQRSSDQARQEP